jgi:hypothetical protein
MQTLVATVCISVFLAGYQKQVAPAYYLLSKQVSPAFGSQLKKHWYVCRQV